MAFFGIFEKKEIKETPSKDFGKALVKKPKNSMNQDNETSTRTQLMEWFKRAYEEVPLINAIVNVQADQIVQEYYFKGPNSKDLEIWADKVNLLHFFYRITKNMLIYGNAFVEVIKSGDTVESLKPLNPIWMETYRTETGEVIGFSQIINNEKLILWGSTGKDTDIDKFKKVLPLSDNIIHFKLNVMGSEKYGTSVIEPLITSIKAKLSMQKDVGRILSKYIAPLIWAKVGNNEMPAQESAVTTIANDLRDLQSESEIVTSHLVDLQVLGFDSKGMDIKTPLNHIEQQIITGGQVPPILLGQMEGSVDKAAEVQLRSFGRRVKSIQREIRVEFEDKILIKLGVGTSEDKLIWGKNEEREWEVETDILRGLVTDGIITPQKANSLLPPQFEEELPEPIDPRALNGQEQDKNGMQKPRPSQTKNDKLKDNPNDPTQTTKNKNSKGRVVKTDRKVPLK